MAEPSMTTPCVVCGRVPTRDESIRRHVGMIVMQRFVKLRQPLCRDHGIEITNTYLRKTLIEGWWGFVSFFLNFLTVGNDLVVLFRYRSLAEPQGAGFGPVPAPGPVAPAPSPVGRGPRLVSRSGPAVRAAVARRPAMDGHRGHRGPAVRRSDPPGLTGSARPRPPPRRLGKPHPCVNGALY